MTRTVCPIPWLLATALLAGCSTRPHWTPPDRACPASFLPVYNADSSVTLCVLRSFRTHDLKVWRRPDSGGWDVFTLNTDISPSETTPLGAWPPKLASGPDCKTSCATADSVIIRHDTIAGSPAYVEIGLVTGGLAGGTRVPTFIASWTLSSTKRAVVQASSPTRAGLDTLLIVLHSVERYPGHAQPPN